MESYGETMQRGAAEYADATDALNKRGLMASFTQTGGMNAALEVPLEAGYSLLITGAEDSLPWSQSVDAGWGVGLYREEIDEGALRFEATGDGSLTALVDLVAQVLRAVR